MQMRSPELNIAEEHLDRIGGLGPDDPDPSGKKRDWLNHARNHLNNARKYVGRALGKTADELVRRIVQVAERIDELAK